MAAVGCLGAAVGLQWGFLFYISAAQAAGGAGAGPFVRFWCCCGMPGWAVLALIAVAAGISTPLAI